MAAPAPDFELELQETHHSKFSTRFFVLPQAGLSSLFTQERLVWRSEEEIELLDFLA